MSREAVNIIKDCVLESGGRQQLLEALAHYMHEDTGLARVSLTSLEPITRLKERRLRQLRDELLAPDTGHGLLQEVQPAARGRKRRADPASGLGVYWLNLRRLGPVAAAVREARRGIHAGAARALSKSKLIGAPATYENARRVIEVLRDAVKAEHEQAAYLEHTKRANELAARVSAISGQLDVLQAVAEADLGTENAAIIAGFKHAETRQTTEESGNNCRINPVNSATDDVNSAISCNSPCTPYKELTPRTNTKVRAGARETVVEFEGGEGLLRSAIETAQLGASVCRWLEGVTAVVEGSVLVLHAPGRLTADRLQNELAGSMAKLARALNLETYRVEG